MRSPRCMLGLMSCIGMFVSQAQEPFALDTTFRTPFEAWYAASILPTNDGGVIISGELRSSGEFFFKTLTKVATDGSEADNFYHSALGGGKITPWQDRFYVGTSQTVRRIMMDGIQDDAFIEMNSGPYFGSLQGGDYHVFPDGRVLMTGAHTINDPARGFNGIYNLIWFSNTGYLDTTRIHRRGNGTISEIQELPDGKFLLASSVTLYEGMATASTFRVHPDGALDTTFHCAFNWGLVDDFSVLDDNRIIISGLFKTTAQSPDTFQLARLMPDGALDPTFHNDLVAISAYDDRWLALGHHRLADGRLVLTDNFKEIDGVLRQGLALLDSNGNLLGDAFTGATCGAWNYFNEVNHATVGLVETDDDMLYVFGSYHGYNDGTTNDTLQRFVSRLYGPDWPTPVEEEEPVARQFSMYPNPADAWVTFNYSFPTGKKIAFISVLDALGREVAVLAMPNDVGQIMLDTRELGVGMYTVCYINEGAVVQTDKLIVQ